MPTGSPTVNSNNIVVGGTGLVAVGATSTAAPTTTSGALNAGFVELGYLSEDGFTFTESKDIADINVWQSFYPARKIITGRNVQVSFSMREWKLESLNFALGRGQGTAAGGTGYDRSITPPSPGVIDYRSLVIEWQDGTKYYRLYFPRGIVTENVEANMVRTDSSALPVTFSAVDPGTGINIYTLFTNDVAFSS